MVLDIVFASVDPHDLGPLCVVHVLRVVIVLIEEPLLDFIVELMTGLDDLDQLDSA